MFNENFPWTSIFTHSNQQSFQDEHLIKSNCLNGFRMQHGQMGYKHASGGWKLSKDIRWPQRVLEFSLPGSDFNLSEKSFQITPPFELIFLLQPLLTSKMPYADLSCCTFSLDLFVCALLALDMNLIQQSLLDADQVSATRWTSVSWTLQSQWLSLGQFCILITPSLMEHQ